MSSICVSCMAALLVTLSSCGHAERDSDDGEIYSHLGADFGFVAQDRDCDVAFREPFADLEAHQTVDTLAAGAAIIESDP